MTKRILAAVMAVLMLCGILAGCNNSSAASSTTSSAAQSSTASAVSSKPEEPKEITIGLAQNAFITDYENNTLTQKLEEELNCKINFQLFASDGFGEKVQLMISAGDSLPDVFSNCGLNRTLIYEYGSNGTFIDLSDYFADPEAMPNFNAIESEDDKTLIKDYLTFANGEMYSMCNYGPNIWNLVPYRLFINTTWLTNLNREIPTTTAELYDTLVAFANEDPNGNGTKDELAMLAQFSDGGGYGINGMTALMNSFIFTGTTMSGLTLSYDGKNVVAPWATEEWKQGIAYLKSLYQAGAITSDSFTVDGTAFKALLNYDTLYDAYDAGTVKSVNVVGFLSFGSDTNNYPNGVENRNYSEYYMIKALKGPEGYAWSPYSQYSPALDWLVTEDCDDPDFAVTMGDLFFRYDFSMTVRFGEEGVDWTSDEEFCQNYYNTRKKIIEDAGYKINVDDTYSLIVFINVWNVNTNHHWEGACPRYASMWMADHYELNYKQDTTYTQTNRDYLIPTSKEYYGEAHPDYILPTLSYTEDEQDRISSTQVDIPTYVTTSFTQFVTGEMDLDTQWDTYLKQLETYGLSAYLEASQAAYERTSLFASVGK